MAGSKTSDWTPERRARLAAAVKARFEDPAQREQLSQNTKKGWATFKAEGKKRIRSPEFLANLRARTVIMNKDPAKQAANSARMRELWATKVFREKMTRKFSIAAGFSLKAWHHQKEMGAAHIERLRNDPVYRAAQQKQCSEMAKSPEVRAKLKAAANTPEAKKRFEANKAKGRAKLRAIDIEADVRMELR